MGGVVYRGDCGVCGWKDRCRDGNLRTYCRVSPILFVLFFGSHPYMFLHFCEMLFLELVSGDFWRGGKGAFLGFYNTYMFIHFFKCFSCNLFFWGLS